MFSHSAAGRDLVPSMDAMNNNSSADPSELESAAQRNLIDESEPIFDDRANNNLDRFTIINEDGDDSYEAEEDLALTVTELSRQRKKQRKKDAYRMLMIASLVFLAVTISLIVFFSVRAKQQTQAYNNKNGSSQTMAGKPWYNKPSPNTNNLSPSSTLILPTTSAPSAFSGSKDDNTPSVYMPPYEDQYPDNNAATGNVTLDQPQALNVDITSICSTNTNNDLTKCAAACSRGKCCWSTNTCMENELCSAYKPCQVLNQFSSSTNNDNTNNMMNNDTTTTTFNGCAMESSPGSFECYALFIPCTSDQDCKDLMSGEGDYLNCTESCSDAKYQTNTDEIHVVNNTNTVDTNTLTSTDDHSNSSSFSDDYYYNATTTTTTPSNSNDDPHWERITFDDFESGWGNFRDGGADSKLIPVFDGDVSNQVARIRCCGQSSILPMNQTQDVSPYKALRVTFWVTADGLEVGDTLLLEYSSDGGSVWNIVRDWVFNEDTSQTYGDDSMFNENGTPYQFNVTFFSNDYEFSTNALIRFRSDANSGTDIFFIDNVEWEGAVDSSSIEPHAVMSVNFLSYCGAKSGTNNITCNPEKISCSRDQDCYENFSAKLIAAEEKCNNDPECIHYEQKSVVEYLMCLTECDKPVAAESSQQWEIITSDNFENGYGNFVDKGGDSTITLFKGSSMVQLRNDNGAKSSLPLRNYYNVSKYAALRVNVTLVFDGIEEGDTLILEYAPDSSTWNIVEEWVFGGEVMSENDVPYAQEATFYNSAYTTFTSGARIRFRSLGNSINDHFLIGNVVFSGLKK